MKTAILLLFCSHNHLILRREAHRIITIFALLKIPSPLPSADFTSINLLKIIFIALGNIFLQLPVKKISIQVKIGILMISGSNLYSLPQVIYLIVIFRPLLLQFS